MVALDNLVGRVSRIKDKYGLNISLKMRRNRIYISLNDGEENKPISPLLNSKAMNEWLDAFEVGLELSHK